MTPASIKVVGIVGGGTMGEGIAQACIASGYQTILYDINSSLAVTALKNISKNLSGQVEKGRLSEEHKDEVFKRISIARELEDFKNADLIIEAVLEKLEVKQKIFLQLEKITRFNCVFVSNTSSISISQIAASLVHKYRFAGLHFFNPAHIMKLVEVVKGKDTSDEIINLLFSFSQALSKHPVLAQDSPGFIVNRVARHYYVESLKVLEEKTADFKTIDALMKASGFRMGPFELMDLIGIDVNLSVTKSIYAGFNNAPRFKPSEIQQQKVDAGDLGRKTGNGFYEYNR
jgi:3-hydroxybutyryl-CoA dehydrogenase